MDGFPSRGGSQQPSAVLLRESQLMWFRLQLPRLALSKFKQAKSSHVYHLGGRMHNVHFLEDSGTVVGDESFPPSISDHLVHSPGAETGSDAIRDGLISRKVPLAA